MLGRWTNLKATQCGELGALETIIPTNSRRTFKNILRP